MTSVTPPATRSVRRGSAAACQIVVTLTLLTLSIEIYEPAIDYLDEVLYLDFRHLMFLLGLLLGVIWSGLSLLKFFVSPHLGEGTWGRHMVRIAPSTFLLNCFMWYFYMFFHRIFSETKADEQYFQTLMIAFSIYFLTVKIGKEIGALYAVWNKDTQG